MKKIVSMVVLILVLALLIGCSSSNEETVTTEKNTDTTAQQAEEKPFYDGENITLIVGNKPGGGYDTYARMVSRSMEPNLPGSTIVVKNMPGAGGIVAANTIYTSEPDGLTFGTFNSALPMAQVTGTEGVKYDVSKMSWLGSPASKAYSWVMSPDSKFNTLDKILETDEQITIGANEAGSQSVVAAAMFFEMMGLDNIKIVKGYSTGEGGLAMRRGEIEGIFRSFDSALGWIENGYAVPVLFIAEEAPEGYEDVPLIQDVVTDPKWEKAVDALLTLNVVARPYAGPPNIPEDRLAILQEAFEKAVKDPEFVAAGEKLQRPVGYVSPDRALKLMNSITGLPDETVQKFVAAAGS